MEALCALCQRHAEEVDHLDLGDASIAVCVPCVADNDDAGEEPVLYLPWEDGWCSSMALGAGVSQ